MDARALSLDDKYDLESGRVFMSGAQALTRLPMVQMRRDRAAGLRTAGFVSGYRGSPLGGYDQTLAKARKWLDALDIVARPAVNEELAATAVWGSQQAHLSPGARVQGVLGIWYGKGPGVDRCGDVFKHANAQGTAGHGGVLALAGDDHAAKSSTVPHQSEHAFMAAAAPVLYPSSIHEFIGMGLLGVAMSRYSGCWVGMKVIADTVETTATVDLKDEDRVFVPPADFLLPEGGLNLRWPDDRWSQDERLQEVKLDAAVAFARANAADRLIFDAPRARLGLIASGKAYEDMREALRQLGVGKAEAAAIGLRVYKVGMPWPLEPEGVRHFAEGLDEALVIEERREVIEHQIKQQLFNWRADVRPRIIGKHDPEGRPVLPIARELTVGAVARAIADRIIALDLDEGLRARIAEKLAWFERRAALRAAHQPPAIRTPWYCAGCPHNVSTTVPEGSRAAAGIGCHFMATWMDRGAAGFTQMGGEGVSWTGMAPFTDEAHQFVNLGDGTYFHSGSLAIRQAVASGANVTYKILYNDAVAMTGGQPVDGALSPERITHQLRHEGVERIVLVSDAPEAYEPAALAPGTEIRHRDAYDAVMRDLRETPGCTAIVYVQTCAAEKRRRRKRGLMEDPPKRVFINPAVCEGCGDCSRQSNCVAVEPFETAMGRKRRINQSVCNKDFSCLKGFCPAFVTVEGAGPRKHPGLTLDPATIPPAPAPGFDLARPFNVVITGVGGTGVLTIGAILGMAAHVEGKASMILDMAGLAQKGGAVLSYLRVADDPDAAASPRIVTGGADLLLAADAVVAASGEGAAMCDAARTTALVNTHLIPVAAFVQDRDLDFRHALTLATIRKQTRPGAHERDFTALAETAIGDAIATNVMMVGYACQAGLLPVGQAAIEQAIELNGVATAANLQAFHWGRLLAADPDRAEALLHRAAPGPEPEPIPETLEEIVAHRAAHLTAYQGPRLARRYRRMIERVADRAGEAVAREAARNYAKLLAYKDEYEVARLYTDGRFEAMLGAAFEPGGALRVWLAPPILGGTGPDGRPKKRAFGPWIFRLFRILARLKPLRGTPFDPFGHSAERRAERALIRRYEADLTLILERIAPETEETALRLAALPDRIRGFGPVKAAAMAQAAMERETLRAALKAPDSPERMAAE